MDLVEADDEYVLRVDLPGLDSDDLGIEVKDNVLTVSGERRAEHEDRKPEERQPTRIEIGSGE